MTTVLVTGGAGFIGSHIVDLCIEQGFKVIVIDSLVHGKIENIHPLAKFYQMDIRADELENIIENEHIEYVIHQAAQVDVQASLNDPIDDSSVNILGSINVIEKCRKSGVKKIIYASSAAVYGDPQYLPVNEKHPLLPQSCYGISKLVPERYLEIYKRLFNLDYTILRYANVYGPRQDSSGEAGVVSIFINRLLKGEIPAIYGDGSQTRDFVFVRDVARANLMALNNGSGETFNVCTQKQTSIIELYNKITKVLGINHKPEFFDSRQGDIKHSCLDRSSIYNYLAWEPQVELEEGIKDTVLHEMNISKN